MFHYSSSFLKASNIGSKKPATIPAAKPLLYKFIPPCKNPTFKTTEECTKAAKTPYIQPNSPAIGAKAVPNSAANCIAGSLIPQILVRDPKATPKNIGKIVFGVLPKAEKPTIVYIPPMVGPFKSPPIINI